jgi:hypothetical protein
MYPFLLILLLHLSILAKAQQIAPATINSAGQSATLNGNTISYAIGDYAIINLADSSYSISGSFMGSTLITAIELNAPDFGKVTIFPNPSSDLLFAELTDISAMEIHLSLYSADAKEIIKQQFTNFNQQLSINISTLPNGIYFLILKNEKGQIISEHKLIKR